MSTKRTGRPVGERVKEACEIVEACGPCDYKLVSVWMEPGVLHNTHKYCNRAVELGLMTVETFPHDARTNAQFSIVPAWREVFASLSKQPIVRVALVKRAPAPKAPGRAPSQKYIRATRRAPQEKQSRWAGVSSVWGMAA